MPERSPMGGRRLLWIHQNFVSARQTGISRAVYLLTALVEAGWTVDLVCPRTGYLDEALDAELSEYVIEREGGLRLHRLGHPKGLSTMRSEERGKSYFGFNRQALTYIRRNIPRADLIFASSPPLTVLLPALELSIRWGAPLLMELRDLWPAMLVEANLVRNPLVIAIMELFEGVCYHYAEHLIPVAPAFGTYLEAFGVPRSKISVNPTGGDPTFGQVDQSAGESWRKSQGLEGRFIALFTGSMNEISNVDRLLEAAALAETRCPGVVWVFAGNGRLRPQIEEAAQRGRNVRYLGALPRDAMPTLYAAADVGLISRSPWPLEEAVYPGKLFDYLSAGLPVVSTHLGQPASVIAAADCGEVLRDRSPQAMVSAVESMVVRSAEERRTMGLRGQRWLLEEMNAFRMGEELRAIVERPWPRRSTGARMLRFLGAGLTGIGALLAGRPRHAVQSVTGSDREAVIQRAFQTWFSRRDQAAPRAADYSVRMPGILSARDTEP